MKMMLVLMEMIEMIVTCGAFFLRWKVDHGEFNVILVRGDFRGKYSKNIFVS